MKLTIAASETSGGFRIVRAKAVIAKSVKLGIPSRHQKTWKVRTVAPKFVAENCKHMFEAEAARWENKVMAKIAKAKEFSDWCKAQKEKI